MAKLSYPRVHVVINPAAGQNQPILNVLNDVFHDAGVEWDTSLTYKSGDATRLAAEAAASGIDLVAAYGGDGTQMEVANGLLETGVPQAILPGGTDNVMAHDLGIPLKLDEAAQLIVSNNQRRAIDLIKTQERVFMLRAFTGLETDEEVSREEKDKLGQLAYLKASLKFMREIEETDYQAVIDGEVVEGKALTCFILNAGSIGGIMGVEIPKVGDVSISDGYLDLYAITKGVKPLRAISKYIFQHEGSDTGVYHWRAREISLEADPAQSVWIDGDYGGKTPITVQAMPQVLEMVVPG